MENKIPYKVIKQITNDFDESRILGSGGFGTVYKGVHENGETIAVKIFDVPRFDDSEFCKEFDNLKGLKHPNIVELVGFCNETEEVIYTEDSGKQVPAEKLHMALCLEYAQNGSLWDFISDESKGLNWHTRFKIIKGVCEGLNYLREGINPPVLHLDLKPQNILLDKDMIPKVADFGLSRLFGEEKTTKTASTCGTLGYLPPEYTDFQVISEKFDIYSLGVIMVKTITGRDRFFRIGDVSRKEFINQVHDNWKKRLRKNLTSGRSLEVYCLQVRRCIEVALECMKKNRLERPTIQEIVSNLVETETIVGNIGMNIEQDQQLLPHGEHMLPEIDFTENPSPENDPNAIRRETQESKPTAMIAPSKELPSEFLKELPFEFLKETTDNFSHERKLGEQAFGTIYKGVLEEGQFIAVVQFDPESPVGRGRTFEYKVQNLSELKHENIIKIYGYCREAGQIMKKINGRHIVVNMFQTLLCYEYFAAGSLPKYIYGETCRLDWNLCFNIIFGICKGLHFLHKGRSLPIIHKDLKPENIFLDNNMVPKIFGFGLYDENTWLGSRGPVGLTGYMAPECQYSGEFSTRSDIYSLGLIILEITTRQRIHRITDQKYARRFIDNARKNWIGDGYIKTMYPSLDACHVRHVKICIAMGLDCVELDQRERPSVVEIIDKLSSLREEGAYMMQEGAYMMQEGVVKYNLLEVHPQELRFPFEPRKPISCSLQLRNKGDDHVAFMLLSQTPNRYLTKLPLCGILPHRCTYTHTITMHKQQQHQPSDGGEFITLHTVAVGKFDLQDVDKSSIAEEYRNFFNKATDVQEVTLTVTCDPPVHQEPTRSTIEIITRANAQQVSSIDVHPTEPWIMTTSKGILHVWNYQTMKKLSLFDEDIEESVHLARFLEQEKWIVAGDANGGIHVYSYEEREEVKFVHAHNSSITSLALHPTRTFLLSSSEDADNLIKLWDWDKNWQCRTFEGNTDKVMQVAFSSNTSGSFTSASLDGTVKIWNIDCDDGGIITLGGEQYGMLLCVDTFKRYNRQHLIAGSMDGTAQIWNMEIKGEGCVQRLEGHEGRISAVILHPELPMLITGSFDGTVRLWNSDTYKLDDIINFNLGEIYAFGFIKDPRRIVVGCRQGIVMMEISTC